MQKTKHDDNVVPFKGYLYPEAVPQVATPEKQKTVTPYITCAALLFIAGLAMGSIAVQSSADYTQIQQLKAQSKQLTSIKKAVCN